MIQPPTHSLESLFSQLGLESHTDDIDMFVQNHSLAADVKLDQAIFWSTAQAQFLRESAAADADWSEVIDKLNALLHR